MSFINLLNILTVSKKGNISQDEIDACREAFLAFDKDRSGTIDVWELRQVLEGIINIYSCKDC